MIGTLTEQVTLLTRQRTPDGGGGAAISWTEGDRLPAQVESLSSRRDTTAERDIGLMRLRITLRHRADIGHGTRLAHDGRTFRITSLQRTGKAREWLQLDAEEVRP
ncbi:head-tail adaptor protein [Aquisalinus flavus]|uniref:Head-tail adaptor protein n=1 Tax=Aquisalinus flavus TaxID=1526572 RepID=A0A8J2V5M3_9PROT|nr:head-tail adaptor protein [Aquisalinus flavus]MBD0426286.1 head-tail adaptor protein [Aquisalinus flavus]GGD09164.1 hypothetical protein GCM10011342_17500 [Aquisalinus flavus]